MMSLKTNEGHKCILNADGSITGLKSFWPMLAPLDASDPWDSVVTAAGGHELTQGRRGNCVYRFRSTPSGQSVEKPWLRRVDFGQALGCNERWSEIERGTMTNPTYMGAGWNPQNSTMFRGYPSPPLFFKTTVTGNSIKAEGAVIPMTFDTYGFEHAENAVNFNGDEYTPALMVNMRQYQRVETNYLGWTDVHLLAHASYYPHQLETTPGDQIHMFLSSGPRLVDEFHCGSGSGEALFFRPRGGRTVNFTSVVAGAAGGWPDQITINFETDSTLQFGYTPTTSYPAYLGPGDFGAVMMKANDFAGSGEPLTVAVAATIFAENTDMARPSELSIQSQRAVGLPAAGEDTSSGQTLGIRNRDYVRRRAGWVGHHMLIITKPTIDEVCDTLVEIERSGLGYADFPWAEVPDPVMEGTELPPELQ